MKKIALIDADGIAYKIAAANEDLNDFAKLEALAVEYINFVVSNTASTHALLFIKGTNNFRKKIATIRPYKGNRIPKRIKWLEPMYFILENKFLAVQSHNAEADDYVSSAAKYFRQLDVPYIVCSHDKDLKQIEGEHFDLNEFEFLTIDQTSAAYRLYYQILTGDSSDNIQGLPRVGVKTAAKILAEGEQTPDGYMMSCINAYRNVYGDKWPQFFSENYRLVYLRTDMDMDHIEDSNIFSFND